MNQNAETQRRTPSLAEISEMTPEQLLNTKWVVDLNALAKTLQSNVDLLSRMVGDEKLISWTDEVALCPEVTEEDANEAMMTALHAMWILGIRRELARRLTQWKS